MVSMKRTKKGGKKEREPEEEKRRRKKGGEHKRDRGVGKKYASTGIRPRTFCVVAQSFRNALIAAGLCCTYNNNTDRPHMSSHQGWPYEGFHCTHKSLLRGHISSLPRFIDAIDVNIMNRGRDEMCPLNKDLCVQSRAYKERGHATHIVIV